MSGAAVSPWVRPQPTKEAGEGEAEKAAHPGSSRASPGDGTPPGNGGTTRTGVCGSPPLVLFRPLVMPMGPRYGGPWISRPAGEQQGERDTGAPQHEVHATRGLREPPGQGLKHRLALRAARFVSWLLTCTCRVRILSPMCHERRAAGEDIRGIYAGWHCYLWHGTAPLRHQGATGMVSSHRDGELIARLLAKQGFKLARGSSTRGGVKALMGFVRAARETDGDMLATIDGPRGPARVAKPGVLYIASLSGIPIIPVGLAVDRKWHLKSWDRMMIGKPFSRVHDPVRPGLPRAAQDLPRRAGRGLPAEARAGHGRSRGGGAGGARALTLP